MQYPIAMLKTDDVFYVTIPDIPELKIQSKDMAEAVSQARMAVFEYMHECIKSDRPIPAPSAIGSHLTDKRFAGHIWAIIHIELARVMGDDAELTIRLPARLMSQVRRQFPQSDINEVILDALTQYLAQSNQSN